MAISYHRKGEARRDLQIDTFWWDAAGIRKPKNPKRKGKRFTPEARALAAAASARRAKGIKASAWPKGHRRNPSQK